MGDALVFVTLAEVGSFSGVARRLGVSRSTVMRRVDAVEERLGVTLVQRAGRRVALTEAGRRYASGVVPVLRRMARLEQEVRESVGGSRGPSGCGYR